MRRKTGGIITTIFLVSLLAVINPVSAQNHVHNIDTGEDFATLQAAIDDTDTLDGHTITIDAVTLTEWDIDVDKDLTITGAGPGSTIIDGEAQDRVFAIPNGTTVTFLDMTITDGNVTSSGAGGILNNGTLTMTNCTVSGNYADYRGGGILNFGTLTMTNCTVSDNDAGAGGGIHNWFGTLTMTNCTVSGNDSSLWGGGIHNESGTLTMNNCTVSGNDADDIGGGIYNYDGTLTMTNCTVSNNYADDDGGGIHNQDGTITLTNCTVSDNDANDIGGGIYNRGTLTMTNCTVSGNYTDYDGGGIYNYASRTLTMNNCTVSGNDAGDDGGGIQNYGTVNAKNTIIAKNTAGDKGPDFRGGMDSYGYNLIGDTANCTISEIANPGTDITGVNPHLGPLAHNGGPTMTHALILGSPAIDAGDCTDIGGNPVLTDQRGVSRPVGSGCDIGAYEGFIYPQEEQFLNPVASFKPVMMYHLAQVNAYLGCIEENLPEDVPEDVQALLDEMQEHINNANTTGNTIYANNELLRALDACDEIAEILGITCP